LKYFIINFLFCKDFIFNGSWSSVQVLIVYEASSPLYVICSACYQSLAQSLSESVVGL